jgi:dihydrodipicolinate synthase/N-acetylneuraminate lyase
VAIPAHPLALTSARRLDERRQRALTRYYLDAGAGGLAVGVHTTQFEIHAPKIGLLQPVLALAAETARAWSRTPPVLVAGVIGATRQAEREARLASDLGYHVALVSLAALPRASDAELLGHLRAVAAILPVMAFYLQPAVGGRPLSYRFWRRAVELPGVVAVKVAPFDRYATLDVIRAVADAGRRPPVALYTGNDDHIVLDLLSTFDNMPRRPLRFAGGLLGHWAFWTRRAVALHAACRRATTQRRLPARLLALAARVTEVNQAVFDPGHAFCGCIPGIHEMLRRQGLLRGRWCLDPSLDLSPGQAEAIDRVRRVHADLADDAFVRANLDRWLR